MSKIDCIKSLKYSFDRTKRWREGVLQKWPDDTRNLRAIAFLRRFSDEIPNMSEAQWETVAGHFHWASDNWHQSLSLVTRRVGYCPITTLDMFIGNLALVLSQNAKAAA